MTPLSLRKNTYLLVKTTNVQKLLKRSSLCLFMLLGFIAARANDFVVSNGANAGAGTLRQAIIDANAAGTGPHTITFSVVGVINLASPLPAITVSGVTIDGAGLVTISGNVADGTRDIITLGVGANNSTIKGLTLQNTGSEAIDIGAALTGVTIQDIVIRHTTNDYINHGIYVATTSTDMTIKNVTITDIQDGYWAVRFIGAVTGLTIDSLHVYSGAGSTGHGLQIQGAATDVTIRNSNIDLDDPATTNDGDYGIYFNAVVNGLTIDSCEFHDCEVYGIYFGNAASNVSIQNSTFDNLDGWTGNQMVRFNSTATNVTINNNNFNSDLRNTTDDGDYNLLFMNNAQKIWVLNNNFSETDIRSIQFAGVNTDSVFIENNTIEKIGHKGGEGAIEFYAVRTETSDGGEIAIKNNVFKDNTGLDIYLRPGNSGNYAIANFSITDNAFSGNKSGSPVIRLDRIDKIIISRNSIYNNKGLGIDLVSAANCGYEGANTPSLQTSVETAPGSGVYNITVKMPAICGTGNCSLELFSTEAGVTGGVGGQHFVNNFTGLSSGINSLTNVTGAFAEITAAPYGKWTATLKVDNNNCGTSEFSNKLPIKINGPAGIDSAVKLWLNPDFTESGNMLNGIGWEDFSGNQKSFDMVYGDPERVEAGLNYNHYINFDGNDYLRSSASPFVNSFTSGEAITVVKTPATNGNRGNPYDFGSNSRGSHYTWGNASVYNGFGTNDRLGWNPLTKSISDGKTGITAASISGSAIDVRNWHIYGTHSATGNWGFEFNGGQQSVNTSPNTAAFNLASGNEHVGAVPGYVFYGDISEVILYNRVLRANERQRINTYLAVKYGLTLAHNYIASDSATIWWDLTANTGFNKAIAGIARDDRSILYQKQSVAVTASDVVTIAVGSILYSANEDNDASIVNNKSALMWGTDSASTAYVTPYVTTYSDSRMTRVWKVQKTNWADATIIVKVAGGNSHRTLLVSADPTFLSGVSSYPLNDTGAVILNSALIPDGQYFTFSNKVVAPACVTNGIQAWFRADDANASGARWPDYSGKERNATQMTAASQPTFINKGINFNAAFSFDGSNDYLSLDSAALGTGNISYSVFSVAIPSSISGGYHYLYVEGNNAGSQRVSTGRLDSRVINSNYGNDAVSASGDLAANTPYILGYTRNALSAPYIRNLYRNNKLLTSNSSATALNKTNNYQRIGNSLASEYWNGYIGEVIIYNRSLSNIELQQVQSYLAIKYGITLDQTTAFDYIASDGSTKMWDAVANATYNKDIAGIGKDTCGNLHQKQSRSANPGSLVTVALGNSIAEDNKANTDAISNNLSFLSWGNNGGSTTFTDSVGGVNATLRMKRVWKADKSNWADQNITVKLNRRALNVYLIINNSDASFATIDQELALSDDSTVTFNSALLPDGAYFTFAAKLYVPGGVAPTALWLRADIGTSSTADNSAVDAWSDNSASGNDALQTTVVNQPIFMDNATDNINFNPVLKFNGTNQFMNMDVNLLPLGTSARSLFATAKPATVSGGYDYVLAWGSGAGSAGSGLANLNGNGVFVGYTNDVSSAGLWQLNVPNEMAGVWLGGSGTAATIYNKGLQSATANKSWNTGTAAGARVGNSPWGSEYWMGTIGDVIVYPAALDAGNRLRVSSYLAIKYGHTMDQTTPTNYLATDSSVIWNATANATHKYGITGIGRDDAEALVQKQSRNSDTARLRIAVGIGTLAETNTANTNNFPGDMSYLLWGDDNASTTYQTTLSGTTFANYRMTRTWKVQETGTVGSVQIALPATAVPNWDEAFLVVSNDATFDGTDNLLSLSAITLNGIKYLAAETEFSDGQYFTFACNIKLPGGIFLPVLWLRSDKGIDNATDGTAVGSWTDYSNQVNVATQTVSVSQPLFLQNASSNINFNPVLKFDGSNDHMENLSAGVMSSQNATLFTTAVQNMYTSRGGLLSYNRTGNTGRPGITLTEINSRIGINNVGVSNVQASVNTPTGPFFIRTLFDAANVSASANGGVLSQSIGTWGVGNGSTQGYYVGRLSSGGFYFNGNIPEVIAYDRTLAAGELQQVESYLSIKYGVTLNSGLSNYLATDGSVIWDAAINSVYNNNVAGIGRDDVEGLTQKQGKSINAGVQVVMALGTVATDNLTNENSFDTDKNYLIWGDDNGSLTEQTTELPTSLAGSKRLGREWKLQLTGPSPVVQTQIDLSSVSITGVFASEIYLLIDTDGDGDFTTGSITKTQASDYSAGIVTFDNVGFANGDVFTIVTQIASVSVNVKAILQGAYNRGTGTMNATLNSSGILQVNAASQPYTTAPFNYAGTESVASGFFAANPDIVDWVLIELRDENTPSTIIAQRAAFIKNDGNIVDVDAVSPVLFPGIAPGNYFIAVRHRNHMTIRSATAQALTTIAASYDFTNSQTQAYQNGAISSNTAMKDLGSGKYALWAADGNSDGKVSYSGGNNDYTYLTNALGGDMTASLLNVYHPADFNLNGKVNASGLANDFGVLTSAVLNAILTAAYLQHL